MLYREGGAEALRPKPKGRPKDAGIVQSMSRKGSCIDSGATEQVFGRMKDGFFQGRERPGFESLKVDLGACAAHWNTRRHQVMQLNDERRGFLCRLRIESRRLRNASCGLNDCYSRPVICS